MAEHLLPLRAQEMAQYEAQVARLWEEHDEVIELLLLARVGGQVEEEAALREQLSAIKAAVQLNARLLGAEECKVWLMGADPRRDPALALAVSK
jgi:hypothetical protein